MNAEIVQVLEEKYPPEPTTEELINLLGELAARDIAKAGQPTKLYLGNLLNDLREKLRATGEKP